ncbi:MAG: GTP-binding protein [Rhodospirillaceae bacterium]
MRLKAYTAPSMAEAMAQIRAELGEDAIIASTQRSSDGNGVRIVAALEEDLIEEDIHQALGAEGGRPTIEAVREALRFHGAQPRLIEMIVNAAAAAPVSDTLEACAWALDEIFSFSPLPQGPAPRPIMLVGPPGTGKTIAVAKLAARARLAGNEVGVVTADSVRAGAQEQLAAFTKILNIDLKRAKGPDSLATLVGNLRSHAVVSFIDSPGLNPFSVDDMEMLRDLVEAAPLEAVLVLNAGTDPLEAAEIAEAFADVGATRILATRLDMARRLGGILAAAEAGGLAFADVSINPHVANGLWPIDASALAHLILPLESQSARANQGLGEPTVAGTFQQTLERPPAAEPEDTGLESFTRDADPDHPFSKAI